MTVKSVVVLVMLWVSLRNNLPPFSACRRRRSNWR